MIAATAMEHGFAVVTRNVVDFEATGVKLLNPWAS
jgi:predicted nucleic acid-binding protein